MIFRNPYFYLLSASFSGILLILYLLKLFPFRYFILFVVLSIFVCGFLVYLLEATLSAFFSGGIELGKDSEDISIRERLSADLENVRQSKRQDRFPEALKIVNSILEKDPDYPDALYLKIQIL
jgi:hypothetical protein